MFAINQVAIVTTFVSLLLLIALHIIYIIIHYCQLTVIFPFFFITIYWITWDFFFNLIGI